MRLGTNLPAENSDELNKTKIMSQERNGTNHSPNPGIVGTNGK